MSRKGSVECAARDIKSENEDCGICARRSLGGQQLGIRQLIATCPGVISRGSPHDHQLRITLYERQADEQEHRECQQPYRWPVSDRGGACNDPQGIKTGKNEDVQQHHSLQGEGVAERERKVEQHDCQGNRRKRPGQYEPDDRQGGSRCQSVSERQSSRCKWARTLLRMLSVGLQIAKIVDKVTT